MNPVRSTTDKIIDFALVVALVAAIIAAVASMPQAARGEDCLNRDLHTAAGDALKIAKHQGGRANVRYVTLYAVPAAKRHDYSAAFSNYCHQLSHNAATVHPVWISDTVLRIDLDQFDPRGLGWAKGWEQIVAHDVRYHAPHLVGETRLVEAPVVDHLVVGGKIEVKCTDGVFRTAEITSLGAKGAFKFSIFGKTYSYAPGGKVVYRKIGQAVKRSFHGLSYGEWIDLSSAKLVSEITGSAGPILDIRDFVYYVGRDPEIYYTFINAPETLAQFQAQFGMLKSPSEFGTPGVRGVNLNRSNVTDITRGLERSKHGVWTSFDIGKSQPFAAEKCPFTNPDRSHQSDAYELLALADNGGMRCYIANGQQKRANFVPGDIAIDDSAGYIRELRPPQSCWNCHTKKRGGEETSGFIAWPPVRPKLPFVKNHILRADLAGYYAEIAKLQRDLLRDREDFRAGVHAATNTGIDDHLEPSEAFAIAEQMISDVKRSTITPKQALVELCIEQTDAPPHIELSRWLNGTVSPALVSLMDGQNVHVQRFRLEMPEALYRIHERKQFALHQQN